MTTIINTKGETDSNFVNLLIGLLVFIVAVVLFILYGLPLIREMSTAAQKENSGSINVNVKLPEDGTQSGNQTEGGPLYKD